MSPAVARRALHLLALLVLLLLSLGHVLLGADNNRYTALFPKQRQVAGNDLKNVDLAERKGTLDGKPLFNKGDSVRVLRDTSITASVRPPYLELTNGDLLPARIIRYTSAARGGGLPAHFTAELTLDPQTVQTNVFTVRVREECLKRIVARRTNRQGHQPGWVELMDRQQVRCESIRWLSSGLQGLTKDGVVSASFSQLADVHFPDRDILAAVLAEASWSLVYPDDLLMRIHTTNGAQLTIPRAMVTRDIAKVSRRQRLRGPKQVEQMGVQPSWALDAIPVPIEAIVFRNYRKYDEVPLSLLPVIRQRSTRNLHYWSWRRNQGVKGDTLRCGDVVADLGLGTHSFSELTFQLPEPSLRFQSLIGLQHGVGKGGCVECRVLAGSSKVIWNSGFLRGQDGIKPLGPLSVQGSRELTLVTDFGHDKRPAGADPYDIRDLVAWLLPTVAVDVNKVKPPTDKALWLAQVVGWSIADELRKGLKLHPVWNRGARRWELAIGLAPGNKAPIRMSRRLRVNSRNAWLPIAARRSGASNNKGHLVRVEVNGQPLASTMNGDIKTERAHQQADSRIWMLGQFLGQEIQLDVVIESVDNWASGVMFESVAPRPLITNLGARNGPLVPEVPLVSLQPSKHNIKEKPVFRAGKLTNGKPLVVRSYAFEQGFGVPAGSALTYELRSEWNQFVAVIGLADGWKGAGPYQIHLDGKLHWSSTVPLYGRNDPPSQIVVTIPPGHKSITLTVLGTDCFGAWANAGFNTR